MIGRAETGSGKTLSFLLPCIAHAAGQKVTSSFTAEPIVVVLAPTRELALQIHEESYEFGKVPRSVEIHLLLTIRSLDLELQLFMEDPEIVFLNLAPLPEVIDIR